MLAMRSRETGSLCRSAVHRNAASMNLKSDSVLAKRGDFAITAGWSDKGMVGETGSSDYMLSDL